MKNKDGVERLFFELASETRLSILRKLQKNNLKMKELTQKLDLTGTETFRQLQRMNKAKLVRKQVDGTYSITQLGKLSLVLSSSIEFVYKNKSYFLDHDVWQLPNSFLYRLGELSEGTLITEMAETMNVVERMIKNAEDYVWVMTDQVLDAHSRAMAERLQKGVNFRSLLHERLLDVSKIYPKGQKVERRYLPEVFGILVVTEKEGGISLPLVNGRADYSGLIGKDPAFLKWISDLFLYYWEKGKR